LPTDLQAVESIAGDLSGTATTSLEDKKPLFRPIAYLTGCSARNVQRLIHDLKDQSIVLGNTAPENCYSGNNTASNEAINVLREKVLNALVMKNSQLLIRIFGVSTFTTSEVVNNIAVLNWEEQLQPLAFAEVELIWRKLIRKRKLSSTAASQLTYNLLHLADRCWLTISGIKDSKPEFLYPFSLSSLGAHVMSANNRDEISTEILRYVKSGASNVAGVVGNPRVVAAAIATTTVTAAFCTIS